MSNTTLHGDNTATHSTKWFISRSLVGGFFFLREGMSYEEIEFICGAAKTNPI